MSRGSSQPRAARAQEGSARRAWAGDPPHVAAARRRLLEAAARCIARDGVLATTVAAIAAEAGVSRQTVYRYFKGRDQVVLRAIRVSAEETRAKITDRIRPLTDPADMIVEGLVLGLAELRTHPVLHVLFDPSGLDASLASRVTKRPGIEWARDALAVAIDAAGWSKADADVALEVMLRMALSLMISPAPERSPEELRAFLYRHLIPGLGLGSGEEP
jgi:AcrR family transcriptional regulator